MSADRDLGADPLGLARVAAAELAIHFRKDDPVGAMCRAGSRICGSARLAGSLALISIAEDLRHIATRYLRDEDGADVMPGLDMDPELRWPPPAPRDEAP